MYLNFAGQDIDTQLFKLGAQRWRQQILILFVQGPADIVIGQSEVTRPRLPGAGFALF